VDAETAIELVQFAYFKEVSGKATKRKRRLVTYFSQLNRQRNGSALDNFLAVIVFFSFFSIFILNTASSAAAQIPEGAGIEPRTVATLALIVRRSDIIMTFRRFGIGNQTIWH
jgi:hypothetical protein